MKFYLTGGAIRDELLGLPVRDKDFIVTRSSEEELLSLGYIKVGNNHDVYLHPKTREEYVLAKNEDLADELSRRDLTINSIAKNLETGEFIDPFDGQKDLKSKTLRHTSAHFADDPIRILRLARFKAQLGFEIAPETELLSKNLSSKIALLRDIPGERQFMEIKKALALPDPRVFFETLKNWGTLDLIIPELSKLAGIEQNKSYHPEGDCWQHTMLVLKAACELNKSVSVRFAALVHDLGKGLTPKDELPSHRQHEKFGLKPISDVCDRLKVDAYTKKLSMAVCKLHLKVHRCFELRPATLLNLLTELNALREGTLFDDALTCCEADNRGKNSRSYPQAKFLFKLARELRSQDLRNLYKKYQGEKLGEAVRDERISLIEEKLASVEVKHS